MAYAIFSTLTRDHFLSPHRRAAPTEPLHCIDHLGLGVVAQGDKQVLIGDQSIDYGPGQSMLTTIDLPVVSHVTRATAREPFLGLMLGRAGDAAGAGQAAGR